MGLQTLKLCWDCKEFEYWPESPHFSEMTPLCPTVMECERGFWNLKKLGNAADFSAAIKSARDCEFYNPKSSPLEEMLRFAEETEDIL